MKHALQIVILISLLLGYTSNKIVSAQTQYNQIEGEIVRMEAGEAIPATESTTKTDVYKLEIILKSGPDMGKTVYIDTFYNDSLPGIKHRVGDKLILYTQGVEGISDEAKNLYYVADFLRTDALVILLTLFITVVVLITKKDGVLSLLGMGYSFIVIFKFILPFILKGYNPLSIAILGALFIAPVTFTLSHGFNKKTIVAMYSTFFSLLITGALAAFFIEFGKLTGFSSEEAAFLQIRQGNVINIKGLMLAGIILSTLGILDDVTVSQASIVNELKKLNNGLSAKEIYKKAMRVGHDHIASAVNTLVLVYTGAALPLLLLFINSSLTYKHIINFEVISEEIIRTIVSSIGLVLAVPITTILAAYYIDEPLTDEHLEHTHSHIH